MNDGPVKAVPTGRAPIWLLAALATGFGIGLLLQGQTEAIATAGFVGGLWLDCLRATIVPLVFALVVTGVGRLHDSVRDSGARTGTRLSLTFLIMLVVAAVLPCLAVPPLLSMMPAPTDLAAAVQSGSAEAAPAIPSTLESLRALIPVNVVASAAAGAMVPLVVFALALGLALGRVEAPGGTTLRDAVRGLGDAMIVIVGWILLAAPIGVFALALAAGATSGLETVGVLAFYLAISIGISLALIILVTLAGSWFGGVPIGHFARAAVPAQAVAASTQSSIATLPAMLAAAARLDLTDRGATVSLPLAVAIFKITAPSNAIVVSLTLAWMGGVEVGLAQMLAAVPLAVLSTFAVLGMPGAVSAYAATVPVAQAMGAPIDMLPLLLAVDAIPDMARTAANVTADVAAAAIAADPPLGEPLPDPPPA